MLGNQAAPSLTKKFFSWNIITLPHLKLCFAIAMRASINHSRTSIRSTNHVRHYAIHSTFLIKHHANMTAAGVIRRLSLETRLQEVAGTRARTRAAPRWAAYRDAVFNIQTPSPPTIIGPSILGGSSIALRCICAPELTVQLRGGSASEHFE